MKIAYLAIPVLALSACAAIHSQEAADSEVLLNQAGFQRRAADSPERQRDLANMPPRQIVRTSVKGAPMYAFADPDNCRCVYVGGPQQYDKLQQLRQARLDEHQQLVMQSESDRSITSELWGPWEPEGLQLKGQR
jgi:hypothetical protein